jgi:hypothetical protein
MVLADKKIADFPLAAGQVGLVIADFGLRIYFIRYSI